MSFSESITEPEQVFNVLVSVSRLCLPSPHTHNVPSALANFQFGQQPGSMSRDLILGRPVHTNLSILSHARRGGVEGMVPAGLLDGGELLRDDLSTRPLNMALNSGLLQLMQKSFEVFVNRVCVRVRACVCVCKKRKEAACAYLWLC